MTGFRARAFLSSESAARSRTVITPEDPDLGPPAAPDPSLTLVASRLQYALTARPATTLRDHILTAAHIGASLTIRDVSLFAEAPPSSIVMPAATVSYALAPQAAALQRHLLMRALANSHNVTLNETVLTHLAEYVANPVHFDGVNDYLTRDTVLTGQADSKQWTGSLWFRRTGFDSFQHIFAQEAPPKAQVFFLNTDMVGITARNAAGTIVLQISASAVLEDSDWHHLAWSVDLSDPTKCHLHLDDVSDLVVTTYTDDAIGFSVPTDWAIGSNPSGASKLDADVADFQMWFGVYVDLSVEANRRLFIDGDQRINPAIAAATLGSPIILQTGPTVSWHTNTGTGGGWTERGELTDGNTIVATGLPEDAALPTPLATKPANTGNISTVLSGAQPGDRINLANGSYGSLTISNSGTQANPLVVRASSFIAGSTSHGVTTGTLTVNGSWVIVSGLDITGSCNINGSNNRVTRCLAHDAVNLINIGPGAHDILIDHNTLSRSSDRMFQLADPKDQVRITVARNWCHTLVAGSSFQSHCFIWADENAYREKHHDIVVRLNYCGPGLAGSGESSDYVHHKGSGAIYACNRFDVGGDQLSLRFGLRKRFVGNYAPGCPVSMFDVLGWYFGNVCGNLRGSGGRSAYYDDTKNLEFSVGGFHSTCRTRIAGNISSITLPDPSISSDTSWCTTTQHETLPDPQPCGVLKPARSSGGVTYAADDPNHPDRGIKIRAHSGTITLSTATCPNIPGDHRWVAVAEIDSQPASAAPVAWRTELFAEYPWLEALVPNPTSQTGGLGGAHPSALAQALTRGNASTPNTGPFRDSTGGLP